MTPMKKIFRTGCSDIDSGGIWQQTDYGKGPQLCCIDFSEMLDVFKEKNNKLKV